MRSIVIFLCAVFLGVAAIAADEVRRVHGGGGVPEPPMCMEYLDESCRQPGYNDLSGCQQGKYFDEADNDREYAWSCHHLNLIVECRAPREPGCPASNPEVPQEDEGPGTQYDLDDADGSSGTDFVDLGSLSCNNPITDIPLDRCGLIPEVTKFMSFHQHLSCLQIIEPQESCDDADCAVDAPRRELLGIAVRLRGIPLDPEYKCRDLFEDTDNEPNWSCQIFEQARDFGLISSAREFARPQRVMTRAEAFSTLMKAICVDINGVDLTTYPDVATEDWQKKVIWSAMRYGFTERNEFNFRENRPMLMQELYTVASRVTQWARENGGCEFVETPECTNR